MAASRRALIGHSGPAKPCWGPSPSPCHHGPGGFSSAQGTPSRPALCQTLTAGSLSPAWPQVLSPQRILDHTAGGSSSSAAPSPISCCSWLDPSQPLDLAQSRPCQGCHWSMSPAPSSDPRERHPINKGTATMGWPWLILAPGAALLVPHPGTKVKRKKYEQCHEYKPG